ncbi:YraN family protein [Pelatocladus sp. BLCC-F211]|uniref:YraN family protein n=1 Tax=Pelatocladus sp. BLCC-F211 TaxID=3342752 RepID=UPI0035B7A44D
MTNHSPSYYLDIGNAGEDLVAHCLQSQGWVILDRRWRCRWGEIDIIAQYVEEDAGTSGYGGHGGYGDKGEIVNNISASPRPPFSGSSSSASSVTSSPTLAFVEVKTRSPRNWDAGGRSAIASSKKVKLWRTAQMFLVAHPDQENYPCRFDVAIVSYRQISTKFSKDKFQEKNLISSYIAGYKLTLQEYIPAAFDIADDFR